MIEEVTGIKPKPFSSNKLNSIVYDYKTSKDDGIIEEGILEIKVISNDMEFLDSTILKIKKRFLKFGDGTQIRGLLQAFFNGGSFMDFDDYIIKTISINIKFESEVLENG